MTIERGPQAEQSNLLPTRELLTPDNYRWFVYDFGTGIRLLGLESLVSGTVVTTSLVLTETRVASHKAWAGARQSRSPGTPWEILQEMGQKGVNPDEKLDEMFRTYGHASVGDMARLNVEFANVPMHLCMAFFNNMAINSGQEKSTRYQKAFKDAVLHDLANYINPEMPNFEEINAEYKEFGRRSLELFAKYREILTVAFTEYFKPESGNKGQKAALDSRVLDCARYFLLFGQYTGMSIETSARDWSRNIAEFKASPVPYYQSVAAQIERLLTPTSEEEQYLGVKAEAPSLIRHTRAATIPNTNLAILRRYLTQEHNSYFNADFLKSAKEEEKQSVILIPVKYTEGERVAAQYLLTLFPTMDPIYTLEWVHTQTDKTKKEISKIIFSGHSNYQELPTPLSRTTRLGFVCKSFLGENRDFNRQRAFGRFVPLPLVFGTKLDWFGVRDIIESGSGGLPLYIVKIPEFAEIKEMMQDDLQQEFIKRKEFLDRFFVSSPNRPDDFSFMFNLLPMAHQVDLWMHGDPKQGLYTTHQRQRRGGHINYRTLAWEANQLIADFDPYLEGLRLDSEKPNPESREEFFDRS